jgi:hypothetical protein
MNMNKASFGIAVLAAVATSGTTQLSQMAPQAPAKAKVSVPVVSGAKALSASEKRAVDGEHCGCEPHDMKPGYGFGTTGHYGPPGQGFDSHNSWRMTVASGGTTTPTGNNLPPTAFK